jgi:hypothetical protein
MLYPPSVKWYNQKKQDMLRSAAHPRWSNPSLQEEPCYRFSGWRKAASVPVSSAGAETILLGGNNMAKRSHNEVQESLQELTRIFRPKDPRKFVKDYIRKYRITGGYEDELTTLVEREMVKLNSPAS